MFIGGIMGIILSWLIGILAFDWQLVTAVCVFLLIIAYVGRSASKR
jgi:hypothetical protein